MAHNFQPTDARLQDEIAYVVNEIGVPIEDAREIAEQRLGRRPPQHRRKTRGPLDMLGESIRRGQVQADRRTTIAPSLPFMKTLNIGGAKAAVEVRK